MAKKAPVKIWSVFGSEPDEIELPPNNPAIGRLGTAIVKVRPVDGLGFDLYNEVEADPRKGHLLYELVANCLPDLLMPEVKRLTPAECAAVIAVALGAVKQVQALAEQLAGNAEAPVTTAEQEPQRSSTLSDLSASVSRGNVEGA